MAAQADYSGVISRLCYNTLCALDTTVDGDEKFFVLFIDDATRFCAIYFMRRKSDIAARFQQYVELMKRFGHTIGPQCEVRADYERVYEGGKFKQTCDDLGIGIMHSPAYEKQYNGVAERFMRTINERVRIMLRDAGLGP